MESTATDNSQRDPLSNWSLFGRLLGLSWQYRSSCVRVLLLQVILLAFGLAGLSLVGLGIDYVHQQAIPGSRTTAWPFGLAPPSSWAPMHVVCGLSVLIIAFALVRSALNYLYLVELARLLQQQIVVHLRSQVYDKMQRLGFRFFDENASGSIINRVTRDVQATRLFIDGVLMQSLIMILSLLMYLTYMFSIHVPLSLVCLVSTPALAVLSARFSRRVRPAYIRSRTLVDEMVRVLSESVQGVRVIKAFAGEPEAIQRYREANDRVHDQNEWIFHRVSRFVPLIGFTTQINLIILLAYGGYLVVKGDLPLGTGLVVFAGLLQQFSMQVANVSGIANSVQESLTSARRVFEILDAPVEIQSPPHAVRLGRAQGGIRFEDVTFSYRPGDPVLSDATFAVAPGQCVAILGATGAGKTSLLSLIARFYDPEQGRVLLDGTDIRDLDLDDLRRNIGIVFQENFLFSNTVAANIAFGHPDATREQIEHAARIASAHDFVMNLADGYDTVLGEDGVDLSGGQRQRLALARAVLLEPAILLLDDPTAAIDPETEADILDAMDSAMRGRTTFLVAHRLSTLRRADLVIVLSRGRIVDMGTHEELMQHDGHYQEAARLQAADQESLQILNDGADPLGGDQP